MLYHLRVPLVLVFMFSLLGIASLQAQMDAVLREPPAIYEEKLVPLMTPIEELLEARDSFDPEQSDGAFLLLEDVFYIDESGKQYQLRQRSYVAVTDAEVDDISEEVHTYRPLRGEKIYLIKAASVLEDGTEVEIDDAGIFVQTPEREADSKIYSGTKEMKLIYPEIKRGSVTHSIVLIEQDGRIPGHFTDGSSWASSWPRKRQRVVVDLPEEWAGRLKSATKGPIPEMREIDVEEEGRVRLVWETDDIPIRRWEELGGYAFDVGPYLRLSTLADWDEFAAWYAGLLDEANTLTPEVKALVQEWTEGVDSREEIIRILFEKAAQDIRYTSINFNNGGIVPQSCESLWKNKYGDCKDKSNFLRLLLAEEGIEAHLTLLNTDQLGLVDPRSPDYRYFDHAIVAIDDEEGGYLFCDPTISYGQPGYLSPRSSNRAVMIVDAEQQRGIWARTPKVSAGLYQLDFDLTLETDGALSGWLTFVTEGFYASGSYHRFRSEDRIALGDDVRSQVRRYYPDAEIVDFELSSYEESPTRFELRVYLINQGTPLGPQQANSVTFPKVDWLFPYLGRRSEVSRDVFVWTDEIDIKARITLPNGWTANALPKPISVEAHGIDARASYEKTPSVVTLMMSGEFLESRITPAEFTPFYNAVKSMSAWLATPVIVAPGEFEASESQDDAPTLGNFPVMPTGEGQIKLALEKYPRNRDEDLYCQALERVIQYFPNDGVTVFRAKIRLGWVDWSNEREEKALRDIRELLTTYQNVLDQGDIGWGRYLEALCLRDLGRDEEALAVLRQIADNEKFYEFRRGWAEYELGLMLEEDNPQEAIDCFYRAVMFDTGDETYHFEKLAEVLLEQGDGARLEAIFKEFFQDYPDYNETLLIAITETAEKWSANENASLVPPLLVVLRNVNAGEAGGAQVMQKLENLEATAAEQTKYRVLQQTLADYIAENEPSFWAATTPAADLETREDFIEAVKHFEAAWDRDRAARHAIENVLRFEPNASFPYYMWRACNYLEWRDRENEITDTELTDKLLSLGEMLPPDTDDYNNIIFNRAFYYRNREEFAKEVEVYEQIEAMELSEAWHKALFTRKAIAQEKLGQHEQAAETYVRLMPQLVDDADPMEQINRAVLIYLELGKLDEAKSILNSVQAYEQDVWSESSYSTQMENLQKLMTYQDGQGMDDYWEATAAWWPQWEALKAKLPERTALDGGLLPPTMINGDSLYSNLAKEAGSDKAAFLRSFDRAMRAARWQPEGNAAITSYGSLFSSTFPEQAAEWRELALAMHASMPLDYDEALAKSSLVWCMINQIDLGRQEEALATAQQFYADYQGEEPADHIMNRLYGILSLQLNDNLEDAASRLEQDLTLDDTHLRANSVIGLANIYRRLGDSEKEKELLTAELENADVKASGKWYERLKDRQKTMLLAGKTNADFQSAVDDWMAVHQPVWYEYAEPKSLKDFRLRNLPRVMDNPYTVFNEHEVFKLKMLVAEAEELELEQRLGFFNDAVIYRINYTAEPAQYRQMIIDILDDERFPDQVRLFWTFMGLYYAAHRGDAADFQILYERPEVSQLNSLQKEYLTGLKQLATLDHADADALIAYEEELLEKGTLNSIEATNFLVVIDWLLNLGQYEAARRLYQQTKSLAFGGDASQTLVSWRLELLRTIKACEGYAALHDILRRGALELLPDKDMEKPRNLYRHESLSEYDRMGMEEAFAILSYLVATDNYPRDSLWFWHLFYGLCAYQPSIDDVEVMTVLAEAIAAAENDSDRADLISIMYSSADYDEPAIRERSSQIVAPWRDDVGSPMSSGLIKAHEVDVAIRGGDVEDIENRASAVDHPYNSNWAHQRIMQYYLQQQEKAKLVSYIKSLSTDELMSPSMLELTLQAFELAAMDDERELASEDAQREVYLSVLNSWATDDSSTASWAMSMAEVLEQPELLPEDWKTHMAANTIGISKLMFELRVAESEKDWPKAEQCARAILERLPTFYEFHWRLGRALYQQGKRAEAVEPLEVYAKYSHDQIEYPTAKKWLAEIQAEQESSRAK
ncbi:DUF3857 and transglutaminase domain-containing protein [Cerasicoccus fimbriatus]|uniref:DUF3857 and transglutaminase domain-containing protein n=1 Tax=Cerasicoccus fimbriatus TaxID=3014554 RepID=UPI0022B34A4D|nr:DUF3857 and transglutaminase domain-containing protein [Cerasicoccus sp. TK19100]